MGKRGPGQSPANSRVVFSHRYHGYCNWVYSNTEAPKKCAHPRCLAEAGQDKLETEANLVIKRERIEAKIDMQVQSKRQKIETKIEAQAQQVHDALQAQIALRRQQALAKAPARSKTKARTKMQAHRRAKAKASRATSSAPPSLTARQRVQL